MNMRTLILFFAMSLVLSASAQTWSYVGDPFIESGVDALSSAGFEDLDFLSSGTPVVSYFRQTGASTTGKVQQYTGGAWSQVGADLPVVGTISAIDLETHEDDIYVSVITNATQISVFTYTGGSWTQLGSAVTGNMAYDFVIDNNGDLYLFTTSDQAIRRYNGTSWEMALDINDASFLQWTGDQSVVVNAENDMLFYQSILSGVTFTFENYVYRFDGSTTEQVGNMVFGGFGTPGKLGVDQDDNIYAQYISDGTNKITRLDGADWNNILDTTNAANGALSFYYTFNAANKILLSSFTQTYYADDFEVLPTLPATGIPTAINNMMLGPDGKMYISFGEIPTGSGMNFSVMTLEESVATINIYTDAIQIYPNPGNGLINVEGLYNGDILRIINMSGSIVYAESILNDGAKQLHLDLETGNYYLSVQRGASQYGNVLQIVKN